jgi:Uma2 family endonuclease
MVIQNKLYTVAEFEQFIAEPRNRERTFELVYGEIVEKMPTQVHAAIVHLLSGFLFMYLARNPIGWALVEARYQMPGDEENARVPDLSFVLDRNRALVEKGAAPYMPDLAVEVQSPDDSLKAMGDKARYYLANGSRMVWLIYTEKRLVEVLTPNDRQLLKEDDTLTGGEVLPGFQVTVRDIFPTMQ